MLVHNVTKTVVLGICSSKKKTLFNAKNVNKVIFDP